MMRIPYGRLRTDSGAGHATNRSPDGNRFELFRTDRLRNRRRNIYTYKLKNKSPDGNRSEVFRTGYASHETGFTPKGTQRKSIWSIYARNREKEIAFTLSIEEINKAAQSLDYAAKGQL
ncbi:hypothetical protein ElyMa_000163100 [Elysia marginata]|uniref:AP2/ERF domain-containing protein n=1 Tax=Elysia marginata TaxID=1093978 RepID=A0AAV4ESL1_9GAST|nr:hypothetical protein ElyMa_000163100 [Elysia marginata]